MYSNVGHKSGLLSNLYVQDHLMHVGIHNYIVFVKFKKKTKKKNKKLLDLHAEIFMHLNKEMASYTYTLYNVTRRVIVLDINFHIEVCGSANPVIYYQIS